MNSQDSTKRPEEARTMPPCNRGFSRRGLIYVHPPAIVSTLAKYSNLLNQASWSFWLWTGVNPPSRTISVRSHACCPRKYRLADFRRFEIRIHQHGPRADRLFRFFRHLLQVLMHQVHALDRHHLEVLDAGFAAGEAHVVLVLRQVVDRREVALRLVGRHL